MNTALTPQQIRIATKAILIYLTIYCLESPVRFFLSYVPFGQLIWTRDLLIVGPLAYITYQQLSARRLNPAITTFIALLTFQATVFNLNFHAIGPAVLAVKLLINVLLGMLIGASFVNARGRIIKILAVLFVLTISGLFIEKFITPFPWLGMSANFGGIEVTISHDWGGDDPIGRRVAGFTRESINAAGLVPFLGIMLATKTRSYLLRALILAAMLGGVFLTTQKGALSAAAMISGCLLLPMGLRMSALRIALIAGAAAQVILPFATSGMLIAEGSGGVFTASSFAARVLYTWPESLKFVTDNSVGPFGLGLGGLGGPMRLLIPAATWMFADNMFILLYAYFGVFVSVFYGTALYGVWRSFRLPNEIAQCPLALLAFVLWYGTVITGVEDQAISLALGLSMGALLFTATVTAAAPRPVLQAAAGRQMGSAVTVQRV